MEQPPKTFDVEQSSYLYRVLSKLEVVLNDIVAKLGRISSSGIPVAIVSAAGNIPIPNGNVFSISGATAVTGFLATQVDIGRVVYIKLGANMTITSSATLLLKNGFSRNTKSSGDVITLLCNGINSWIEVGYKFILGKPRVYASRAVAHPVETTALTAITIKFDTSVQDTWTIRDNTTQGITIPVTGYYTISITIRTLSMSNVSTILIGIGVNGVTPSFYNHIDAQFGGVYSDTLLFTAGTIVYPFYFFYNLASPISYQAYPASITRIELSYAE